MNKLKTIIKLAAGALCAAGIFKLYNDDKKATEEREAANKKWEEEKEKKKKRDLSEAEAHKSQIEEELTKLKSGFLDLEVDGISIPINNSLLKLPIPKRCNVP